MTVAEILIKENQNIENIFLFKEGIFWRAYERSAFFFVKHIKSFQVTKKHIKNVKKDIVYLGFTESSLNAILQLVQNKNIEKTEKQIICGPFAANENEFIDWKNNIVITTEKTFDKVLELCQNSVLEQLNNFAVATKTPVECQLFIINLQNQLHGSI